MARDVKRYTHVLKGGDAIFKRGNVAVYWYNVVPIYLVHITIPSIGLSYRLAGVLSDLHDSYWNFEACIEANSDRFPSPPPPL